MRKALLTSLLCILLLLSLLSPAIAAGETVRSTSVKITSDHYITDTFCGVPAYYNKNSNIQCNEYIMRFYDHEFGLYVFAYSNTGLIMMSNGYEFQKTTVPKPGDVYYAPAEKRGKPYDHWAIVKQYNAKAHTITLIEQNFSYTEGGIKYASVNREVRFPYSTYDVFTPISTTGANHPTLHLPETTTTQKATATRPAPATSRPSTRPNATQPGAASTSRSPSSAGAGHVLKNEAVDSASTSSSHVKASLEASTCTASGDTQTELITIGPNEEATPLYNDSEPVSQAANAISQLNRSWIIPVIAATFLLLAGGMIWLLIRRKSSK